jgi:hypothetical protein
MSRQPVFSHSFRFWPLAYGRRGKPCMPLLALWIVWCALLLPTARAADQPNSGPIRVLIIGGGPTLEYNQVAIESNVRYVGKLLPPGTVRTTLFADGDAGHATVLYEDDPNALPVGEQVLNLLLHGTDSDTENPSHYRKPNLGARLDGASKRTDVNRAFSQLVDETAPPGRHLLIYFTGHGSPNSTDMENNQYDLWGKSQGLSVRELARQIAKLPEDVPVTVVMVQCFSGAFGNLIFEGGDPKGAPVSRDVAGFFATVKERVAAGCTSAVNEAEYKDFTSYFFAALTGRDRVGRRVTGADYNGDGRVGMDEAYCYTLVHDESIDVPVCTSDVFLRRMVESKDLEVFQTPYSSVQAWAGPAQRAALDALSERLHLGGENRLSVGYKQAFSAFGSDGKADWRDAYQQSHRRFETLRKERKRELIRRFPELALSDSSAAPKVREEAIAQLTREVEAGKWKDLLEAVNAMDKAQRDGEAREIAQSKVLRFIRLAKSVVLAHRLEQSGQEEVIARYKRLVKAEGGTPLPPAETLNSVASSLSFP